MRARAQIAVVGDGPGSHCRVLRSDPPFTFRGVAADLRWVGSAAAPVGGDDLGLELVVGPGALLRVRSVAASIAHPGPTGAPSHAGTDVRVDQGGRLVWEPQPLVLVAGCDHRARVRIDLAPDAEVVWRDEVVLGRHQEPSGSLRQRMDVERAGLPLLRTELVAGPRWPGADGPAGTAGAGAVGSLLMAGPTERQWPTGGADGRVRAAVQPLAPGAVLVSALATTAGVLRDWLDDWQHEASLAPASGTAETCCSSGSSSP